MNKKELVEALRMKTDLSKTEAARTVDLVFDSMADTLARSDRVEIRGLCSFYVKKYKGYAGRNPKTGERANQTKEIAIFQGWKRAEDEGQFIWLIMVNGPGKGQH